MTRLTDEELANLERLRTECDESPSYINVGSGWSPLDRLDKESEQFYRVAYRDMPDLLAELRSLRAGLTDDDARALRWARDWLSMDGHGPQSVTNQQTWRQALAVLDRLLLAGGKP